MPAGSFMVGMPFPKVDGPYKAMILPAAKEEGKKLKKRCVSIAVLFSHVFRAFFYKKIGMLCSTKMEV